MPRLPRAVSFDFHDTIAIAPAWFQLEVRELPVRMLDALGVRADDAMRDTATAAYRAMRAGVQQSGIEQDALAGAHHALRAVGIERTDADVAAAVNGVFMAVRDDARPRPGIIEAVRALAGAGVPLAVISSAIYHPFLLWCLDDWGMSGDFAAVITSASCGYYKSHDGIYACALDTLAVAPADLLHVGDSYRFDVETPYRLGIRTCWLNLKGEERDDNRADMTVPDLAGFAGRVLSPV